MFSTTIFIICLLLLFIVSASIWAVSLAFGLRLARVREYNWKQIWLTTAIVSVVGLLIAIVFAFFEISSSKWTLLAGFLELIAGSFASTFIISKIFKLRMRLALKVWLPTLLSVAPVILIAVFIWRPFFFETCVSPTNSMAPVILGTHWQSHCPICDQVNVCSPVEVSGKLPRLRMICENFHVESVRPESVELHGPDHFLVNKLISPERWDLITFVSPPDPSSQYVFRLVGLPGETVRIEEGAVWIDDEKLSVPEELAGISYTDSWPNRPASQLSGTSANPATLGDDEYFVLGDFSYRAFDSRLWPFGFTGHNQFAIPKSKIIGVVTHVYWPPSRMRILK